jgi:hypothetical protein
MAAGAISEPPQHLACLGITTPRAMQFSCLVSPVSIKAPATRRGPSANGLTLRPWRGERPFAPTVLAEW